jgi:MerR family copper efflux transcriptional regulator
MVKRFVMLIAEFCRQAGLSRDAVRLYVKLGLLTPGVGANASNRYQQFAAADVERAAIIRMAQQLGFTLKQIVALNREYEAGAMDTGRKLAVMRNQLEAVAAQAERIRVMRKYLRAKIAWLEGGERGAEPAFCGMRSTGLARPASAVKRVA